MLVQELVPRGDDLMVLHCNAGELEPVEVFWSATIEDVEGVPVANPLARYPLGDHDPLKLTVAPVPAECIFRQQRAPERPPL